MQRRDFLKYSVALGVASALPLWSRAVFAAERPTLPIPDLLTTDARNRIQLTIGAGQSTFGGKTATTWGYNGNLLGPAVKLQRGKAVTVDIYNQLTEETTLHWHGLEVPGEVDGGPQGIIPPGGKRSVTLNVDQPAATCWFHPHQHGKTGRQVAMGLAGLVVIEDDEILKLMLPKQWGIDDVPVIVQDKKFDADGQIDYQLDVMTAAVGWFGDTLLTNGAIYPQHAAPRGWLRLRLLNGCNARSLNFATSDNRPLYVIASDGGLLPEPVKVNELPVLMGERFEVLVEVNDNKPFDLVTLPVSQMGMAIAPFDKPHPVMRIQPIAISASGALPDTLSSLPALPSLEGLTVENGTLQYHGKQWDSMSGSEQLRVAAAIVRKLNPDCGFVLLDKLEQMDSVTLQEFGQWLEQEGLQAIATRVSTGDECSVIIEDGYSVDTRPAQPVQTEPLTPPIIQKAWTKGAF